MHTLQILIPAQGGGTEFDPTKYKRKPVYTLSALRYKSIDMQIIETESQSSVLNKGATRLVSYLLNPYTVFTDIEIKGDVILHIISKDKITPTDAREYMDNVLRDKELKRMPPRLRDWLNDQLDKAQKSLDKESDPKKRELIQSNMDYVRKSMKNYGAHLTQQQVYSSRLHTLK